MEVAAASPLANVSLLWVIFLPRPALPDTLLLIPAAEVLLSAPLACLWVETQLLEVFWIRSC